VQPVLLAEVFAPELSAMARSWAGAGAGGAAVEGVQCRLPV